VNATVERYQRAVQSSNLEVDELAPGDVDALIAAGLVRDGLGPSLIRLRSERDAVSKLPGARSLTPLLKSMTGVKLRMHQMAIDAAALLCPDLPEAEAKAVAERAIDFFLDPNCPPCGGTGIVGEYGKPQHTCNACRGTTRRQAYFGSRQDLEALFDRLMRVMEEKVDTAWRRIRSVKAEVESAKGMIEGELRRVR
jgi:hypothetical protein